jgi:hypothetical protein
MCSQGCEVSVGCVRVCENVSQSLNHKVDLSPNSGECGQV